MKFLAITLIVHAPASITGQLKSTTARLREVVDSAVYFEDLGFDGYGVGERHERPFISSSPPVVLRRDLPSRPFLPAADLPA
jgi:alkanesulfonate monooxygenase SsuD/methylene tetrahydromethanopterin reductase-like flavin-dependent oxidoreductase (luciferase family)